MGGTTKEKEGNRKLETGRDENRYAGQWRAEIEEKEGKRGCLKFEFELISRQFEVQFVQS